MIEQLFKDIYDEELAKDAIINDRHTGHKEDYLVLHCLIKKYKPKSFFEVGQNTGFGTKIICNAITNWSNTTEPVPVVYSLDLPDDESWKSKQHPISEGKKGVGYECNLPFIQLRGDSKTFNFSEYPCEGYFIDGEHIYQNVFIETDKIMQLWPKLVVFHDCDVEEVLDAVKEIVEPNKLYNLYRITDTRIAYAIEKPSVIEPMLKIKNV